MNENYEAGSEIFFEPPVRKDAKYYRGAARECLKGHFWKLVLMMLISLAVVALIASGLVMGLRMLLSYMQGVTLLFPIVLLAIVAVVALMAWILAPWAVGISRALLRMVDGEKISIGEMLNAPDASSVSTFFTGVLIVAVAPAVLILLALGSVVTEWCAQSASPWILIGILAMVLGVVSLIWALLRLSFVFRIRAEYPELSAMDSLRNSIALAKLGGKKLVGLSASFLGWYALALLASVLTFGVGAVLLCPVVVYHQAALTLLYHDLAQRGKADEVEFPSLDPDDYDLDEANW